MRRCSSGEMYRPARGRCQPEAAPGMSRVQQVVSQVAANPGFRFSVDPRPLRRLRQADRRMGPAGIRHHTRQARTLKRVIRQVRRSIYRHSSEDVWANYDPEALRISQADCRSLADGNWIPLAV